MSANTATNATNATGADAANTWLRGRDFDRRYRITSYTRRRWQQNPDLQLPPPMMVNGRPLWLLADLLRWEQERSRR